MEVPPPDWGREIRAHGVADTAVAHSPGAVWLLMTLTLVAAALVTGLHPGLDISVKAIAVPLLVAVWGALTLRVVARQEEGH